jgi:hypothetical protein
MHRNLRAHLDIFIIFALYKILAGNFEIPRVFPIMEIYRSWKISWRLF